MKISKSLIKALEVVKCGTEWGMLVYTQASVTDLGLIQIHWATHGAMEEHGLILEIDEFNHGDNRKLELTFKGQCVLAMARNKSVAALKGNRTCQSMNT